jgi:filamentous hemagglutinin family protein
MRARAVTAALGIVLGAFVWSAALAAPALPQGPTIAGSTAPPGASFDTSVANTLNVNQSASRVVIDWRSFDIGAGGTVNFNQASPAWIAFNRVLVDPSTGLSPLSMIDGALNAQGGVWLFSTGGILFGPNAVVNVGTFAGVTGPLSNNDISQLLNPNANGVTSVSVDPPIGPGAEDVTVQSGAQISALSGFVWLQAETMVQNGAIAALDGVGYAVAETGAIQFTTTPFGQQIVSEGVMVVPGQDRPSFSHAGSTSAAWVGIDTPGGALQAGYHTLINLGGEITATGIKPGTGDQGVVLLVGGNLGPAYPNYSGSSIGVDASSATINATNGMFVWTDSAKLGRVTLGAPLDVETYGDLALTAPVSVAAGGAQLNSVTGMVAIDANLTADQSIGATGQTITVGPGVTVRSDALGAANGGIVLAAAGDVSADPTSLLIAGTDPAAPTDSVTVTAGDAPTGGNITVGSVSGVDVFIHAKSQGVAGQGALTLAGNIVGSDSVTAFIDDVTTQNNPTGDLRVLGNVSSAGFVDIENLGTGALILGPGATVRSTGDQVFLTDGGNTSVDAGASIIGVSIFDHTTGALTIASGASLSTTGTSPAPTTPVIPAGSEFQRASGLNLAAGTLDIQGAVTAGSAGAPDDIYIEALNTTGPAVIGGAGGGSGFNLTNASFAHLSGRDVVIMGGPGEGQGAGVDLTVDDLTLDSSKISALWLGTDSGHSITVAGAVTPAGAGPVDVQIGFAREGASPDAGLDGFIPGEIDVTGALGAPNAALTDARLIARNDILIGAPGFVASAQANPNFDALRSSTAFPVARDKVFVATGVLQLSAQGRILQQNTAPSLLTFAGLAVGAPTAAAPLIAAPTALQGQAIGGDAWTADFAAGPSEIQLFGALASAGGRVVNDQTAALAPDLLDPAIANRTTYEINSCVFGQTCASPIAAITFEPPPNPAQAAQEAQAAADAGTAVAGAAQNTVFSVITPTSTQQDEDRLGVANPLTETGNGDLWTAGSLDCGPASKPHRDCP